MKLITELKWFVMGAGIVLATILVFWAVFYALYVYPVITGIILGIIMFATFSFGVGHLIRLWRGE